MSKEPRKVTVYNREGPALNLEAQREAVKQCVTDLGQKYRVQVLGEYIEPAADRRGYLDSRRREYKKALDEARQNNAILVIGCLGRLQRSLPFLQSLADAGVEFACCDNPQVNPQTLPALLTQARTVSERQGQRTRRAAEEARQRGEPLGSQRPQHWAGREHKRGWKKAVAAATQNRIERTETFYALLEPVIRELREAGNSESEIAAKLNELGHRTTVGKPFTQVAVHRALKRLNIP